jgi:hypothetical protein
VPWLISVSLDRSRELSRDEHQKSSAGHHVAADGREPEVLHRISGLRCRDGYGLGVDVRLPAESDSLDYRHATERKSGATAKHVDRGRGC